MTAVCANCRKPTSWHCLIHVIPCCPGRCVGRRPADAEPCEHTDAYGSTVIFDQDRPQDGICMLCDQRFPGMRVIEGGRTVPVLPSPAGGITVRITQRPDGTWIGERVSES